MRRFLICLVLLTGCGPSIASQRAEASAIYTAEKEAYEKVDADIRKLEGMIRQLSPADQAKQTEDLTPLKQSRQQAQDRMNAALAKMKSFEP